MGQSGESALAGTAVDDYGPLSPQFNVAQPWVKGYNGEVSLSKNGHYSTVMTRVWIDQDMKREMGF